MLLKLLNSNFSNNKVNYQSYQLLSHNQWLLITTSNRVAVNHDNAYLLLWNGGSNNFGFFFLPGAIDEDTPASNLTFTVTPETVNNRASPIGFFRYWICHKLFLVEKILCYEIILWHLKDWFNFALNLQPHSLAQHSHSHIHSTQIVAPTPNVTKPLLMYPLKYYKHL